MKISAAGYSSHMPVLIKLVNMTDGPILELGTGLFSTPYLHWACFSLKRKLVSYDDQEKYIEYVKRFQSDYHDVILVDTFDNADIEKHWNIAFVDHQPCLRRVVEIARLAAFADYVVLHDTQISRKEDYQYYKIYPMFKYRYDFKEVRPHTSVLSNFIDLKDFKI